MANNRYVGDYPVISIRPCIDGAIIPSSVSAPASTAAAAR